MEPYRYRKKLMKSGNGKYVLLPADWVQEHVKSNEQEVIVEVFDGEIKIHPYKKK